MNLFRSPAFQLRHQSNVLLDVHVREQSDFLDGITNMAAQAYGVPVIRGFAFDDDLPFLAGEQIVDEFESCSFSRATAAQQHQSLSG